jgi:hypothetical protein
MRPIPRRGVGVRVRLAVAGAVALTAITMAAADAATAATAARGFLLRNGIKGPFTPLDAPGASATFASAINDLGQIVGADRVAVPATNALSPQPRLAR